MCVIIYKKAGTPEIPEYRIRSAYRTNKDGFGAMWRSERGHVMWLKLMLNDADDAVKQVRWAEKQADGRPCAFHFRIATHGTVCKDNCHPFLIKPDAMLMHNGVIKVQIPEASNLTDSETFARQLATDRKTLKDDFSFGAYFDARKEELIGSKLLVFAHGGEYLYPAEHGWHDLGDGILWSNLAWQYRSWQSDPYAQGDRIERYSYDEYWDYMKGVKVPKKSGTNSLETKPPKDEGYQRDLDNLAMSELLHVSPISRGTTFWEFVRKYDLKVEEARRIISRRQDHYARYGWVWNHRFQATKLGTCTEEVRKGSGVAIVDDKKSLPPMKKSDKPKKAKSKLKKEKRDHTKPLILKAFGSSSKTPKS